jgi:SAM-dependent methyltransferase
MTPEFDLGGIRPWGRRLSEYRAFFSIDRLPGIGPMLDVGAGPSSFTAEATRQGAYVTAIDPMYRQSARTIRTAVSATADAMRTGLARASYRFVWDHYGSPEALYRLRQEALDLFLADFDIGRKEGRYRAEALPTLSLPDHAFRLALCSHLLFLYSEQLDLEFHIRSIRELLRVADEIRIFPLIALNGAQSPHLDPVMKMLDGSGAQAELVPVPFEFQKGSTRMLRVRRS